MSRGEIVSGTEDGEDHTQPTSVLHHADLSYLIAPHLSCNEVASLSLCSKGTRQLYENWLAHTIKAENLVALNVNPVSLLELLIRLLYVD